MLADGAKNARILEVDLLRGFALLGILPVNLFTLTQAATGPRGSVASFVVLGFDQRFLPVFVFLFGYNLILFISGIRARGEALPAPLLRRLLILVLLGAIDRLWNPDDVLLPYALVAIVAVIPALRLPVKLLTTLGGVVLAAGVFRGGGYYLLPGLILLGAAASRVGLLERSVPLRRRAPLAASALAVCVLLTFWQQRRTGSTTLLNPTSAAAGLCLATTYAGLFLAISRGPAVRQRLSGLAKMGRMSLTLYLSGTGAAVLLRPWTGSWAKAAPSPLSFWGVVTVLLLAQLAFAQWWLGRHRHGPVEWLWRCGTRLRIERNRIPKSAHQVRG